MSVLWGRIRNRLSTGLGHRLILARPDDVFIAAFPRSGSTWLRTVLVNIMRPDASSDPDVFNAVIPGVSIRNAYAVHSLPSPRVIMSHGCWIGRIRRAVYLVRDGRDALVSFYHFLVTREGREDRVSFDTFFDAYCKGAFGRRWDESVESWLGRGQVKLGADLLVVHFEQLKASPPEVVAEVAGFLGLRAEPDRIRAALEAASIDRMRKIEKSRRGRVSRGDASFYRGGRSGQWRERLSEAQLRKFVQMSSNAMAMAGYES